MNFFVNFPTVFSSRKTSTEFSRDPSKRHVKPADSDFLPVEAFQPEETTASDDEYQPDDEKEEAVDDNEIIENTRKRKIQDKTTSPTKLARKQKESPIGKIVNCITDGFESSCSDFLKIF